MAKTQLENEFAESTQPIMAKTQLENEFAEPPQPTMAETQLENEFEMSALEFLRRYLDFYSVTRPIAVDSEAPSSYGVLAVFGQKADLWRYQLQTVCLLLLQTPSEYVLQQPRINLDFSFQPRSSFPTDYGEAKPPL